MPPTKAELRFSDGAAPQLTASVRGVTQTSPKVVRAGGRATPPRGLSVTYTHLNPRPVISDVLTYVMKAFSSRLRT